MKQKNIINHYIYLKKNKYNDEYIELKYETLSEIYKIKYNKIKYFMISIKSGDCDAYSYEKKYYLYLILK